MGDTSTHPKQILGTFSLMNSTYDPAGPSCSDTPGPQLNPAPLQLVDDRFPPCPGTLPRSARNQGHLSPCEGVAAPRRRRALAAEPWRPWQKHCEDASRDCTAALRTQGGEAGRGGRLRAGRARGGDTAEGTPLRARRGERGWGASKGKRRGGAGAAGSWGGAPSGMR
ncbi:hypothetical protein H8959_016213 [Pygathrix nigripes]